MRTTVEFDADTAKAVDELRREQGLGVSEAVNVLVRRGMLRQPKATKFRQPTRSMGLRIDVSNVAEALETLDGADR